MLVYLPRSATMNRALGTVATQILILILLVTATVRMRMTMKTLVMQLLLMGI
jgi:hypothetical protein